VSRTPLEIIAENTELTADAIDSIRHEIRNMNKPVIEALGQVLAEVSALREDVQQGLKSHDEQLQTLRKAVFSGHTAAE
jgi:hypothetical protein